MTRSCHSVIVVVEESDSMASSKKYSKDATSENVPTTRDQRMPGEGLHVLAGIIARLHLAKESARGADGDNAENNSDDEQPN
jgi:hypothetical protein